MDGGMESKDAHEEGRSDGQGGKRIRFADGGVK